jgi:hypothetical protein
MEYLVPRRAPDGRLVFVAQACESDPPPEDDRDYPTILRVENRIAPTTDNREHRLGSFIADNLLKVVGALRYRHISSQPLFDRSRTGSAEKLLFVEREKR